MYHIIIFPSGLCVEYGQISDNIPYLGKAIVWQCFSLKFFNEIRIVNRIFQGVQCSLGWRISTVKGI